MTKRERVLAALKHLPVDRIPKGEVRIMEYEIEEAKLFIDNGADAIFFADDIAAVNSGFILSTCNSMADSIPPQNVLAMMEEAENVTV